MSKVWRPSHSDVMIRLLEREQAENSYVRDYLEGLEFNFGDVTTRADLVLIESGRSVRAGRGKTLVLYEIRTESRGLMPVLYESCRQIELYRLGLRYPRTFVSDPEKAEKIGGSLSFKVYIVLDDDVWFERVLFHRRHLDKMDKLLKHFEAGIITYNKNWKFKSDSRYFGFDISTSG